MVLSDDLQSLSVTGELRLPGRFGAVEGKVGGLQGIQRCAFVLQRRDGCTVDEIAGTLGISRSMVKKYLGKALVHCQRALQDKE